jgi:magnesium transporter
MRPAFLPLHSAASAPPRRPLLSASTFLRLPFLPRLMRRGKAPHALAGPPFRAALLPPSLQSALPLAALQPAAFESFLASGEPPQAAAGGALPALALPTSAGVADAVRYVRAVVKAGTAGEAPPEVVFVVDGGLVLGHVALSELFLADGGWRLGELARVNFVVVLPGDGVGKVAQEVAAAGVSVAPVVDGTGRLVGMVRAADLARIAAGAGGAPYFSMGFESLVRSRAPWLVSLLMLQSVSSWILGQYGGLIERNVLLAFFLTTVVGAGGNSGSQSAAMLIVGLARGEIDERRDFWRVVTKELAVAVALGGILACVAFLRVLVLGGGGPAALLSSFTIALALLLTVIAASVMGSATPMLLKRAGVDPALGSGPALATLTDICGVLLLCFTASLLLAGP